MRGSPPQVRGKLRQPCFIQCMGRITPAGAGKTFWGFNGYGNLEDHPRRCGENAVKRYTVCTGRGSPPQVRGKPLFHTMRCGGRGITPAGAGKTEYKLMVEVQAQDHPRRCGENLDRADRGDPVGGSPPQVRGKRKLSVCLPPGRGITPAGAGKTKTA